jgi:hypothetical protein
MAIKFPDPRVVLEHVAQSRNHQHKLNDTNTSFSLLYSTLLSLDLDISTNCVVTYWLY